MKISVVIPAHNEEAFIGECLKRLSEQTRKADEIIVVDNNSTDKTVAVAQRYGARIVKERTMGIIYARNKGFNAARGDIIARTDADTIVTKNWVETIYKSFINKKNNLCAVGGVSIITDTPLTDTPKYFSYFYYKYILRFLSGMYQLRGPNMAISRRMWYKVRKELCVGEEIQEDIDLSYHIMRYGHVLFNPRLIAFTSDRRKIRNPLSFFVIYPVRNVIMLATHWNYITFIKERMKHIPLFNFNQIIKRRLRMISSYFSNRKFKNSTLPSPARRGKKEGLQ